MHASRCANSFGFDRAGSCSRWVMGLPYLRVRSGSCHIEPYCAPLAENRLQGLPNGVGFGLGD